MVTSNCIVLREGNKQELHRRDESCADEIKDCNKWDREEYNGKGTEGNEYYNMLQNNITYKYNYYNINESSAEHLKQLSQRAQNKKAKHKNKMIREVDS